MIWLAVLALIAVWSTGSAKTVLCPCDDTTVVDLADLRQFEWRLERLERTFLNLGFNQIFQPIQGIWHKVDLLYKNYEMMTVTARQQQYNVIHSELSKVSVNIDKVSVDWDTEMEPLLKELENLWIIFDKIIKDNSDYNLKRCMENVKDLQDQVDDLRNNAGTGDNGEGINGGYVFNGFRGDTLPLQPITDGWCKGRGYPTFPYPISHRFGEQTKKNFWFKDPWPLIEANRSEVVLKSSYASNKHQFFTYDNYESFVTNSKSTKALLLLSIGSGHANHFIIYKGRIIHTDTKMDIKSWYTDGREKKEQIIALPKDLNMVAVAYKQQGSFSPRVDIQVDEYGIYVIYANKARDKKLSISRLDESTLLPVETWHTNVFKESVCTAFMMCGKMYAIDNCQRRIVDEAHQDYVFDTHTGENGYVPSTLVSLFGNVERLSYNPRERLLFGWDNGHALTYPIFWT